MGTTADFDPYFQSIDNKTSELKSFQSAFEKIQKKFGAAINSEKGNEIIKFYKGLERTEEQRTNVMIKECEKREAEVERELEAHREMRNARKKAKAATFSPSTM